MKTIGRRTVEHEGRTVECIVFDNTEKDFIVVRLLCGAFKQEVKLVRGEYERLRVVVPIISRLAEVFIGHLDAMIERGSPALMQRSPEDAEMPPPGYFDEEGGGS